MSSIIQRNIAQLGQKFLKDVNYKDIDYRGYVGESIDPTLQAGQVLINDLKIWIQSSKGDYYRRLSMGGFFDSMQQYPLKDEGTTALIADLRSAINSNFPTIEILDLQVTPEYNKRAWIIKLIIRDKITGALGTDVSVVDAST